PDAPSCFIPCPNRPPYSTLQVTVSARALSSTTMPTARLSSPCRWSDKRLPTPTIRVSYFAFGVSYDGSGPARCGSRAARRGRRVLFVDARLGQSVVERRLVHTQENRDRHVSRRSGYYRSDRACGSDSHTAPFRKLSFWCGQG